MGVRNQRLTGLSADEEVVLRRKEALPTLHNVCNYIYPLTLVQPHLSINLGAAN